MQRSNSDKFFKRACEIFPGGVNSPVRAFKSVGLTPFIVARGEGPYLFDIDGNRYVDLINSWGPLVLGHADPDVVEAIATQASRGTSFGACSENEVELATEIQNLYPSIEMIRFVNSGTEAGMSAIKLARGFTKKNKILKFEGCYHGHVDSLLAKAGSGVMTLSLPECAGIPTDVTSHTLLAQFNDLSSVENLLNKFGDDVAAIIVEPVVGNCGLLVPEKDFLPGLRKLADQFGSLLIFDEVMTGCRVDLGGAQKLYGVKPDLTMLGKVIGGGLPVGAFGGKREIMEFLAPIGPVYQAGTLSGNPLAMKAGVTTLRKWRNSNLFEVTTQRATRLMKFLASEFTKKGIPCYSDSVGTMFGFFFNPNPVKHYSDTQRSDRERFNTIFKAMLDRGVFFAPSSFEAGFLSAAHTDEVIDYVCEMVKEVGAI